MNFPSILQKIEDGSLYKYLASLATTDGSGPVHVLEDLGSGFAKAVRTLDGFAIHKEQDETTVREGLGQIEKDLDQTAEDLKNINDPPAIVAPPAPTPAGPPQPATAMPHGLAPAPVDPAPAPGSAAASTGPLPAGLAPAPE